jgi:hypothetical protein
MSSSRQAGLVAPPFGRSNSHSDKEKFCSDLNRPKSCKISEWVLKTLQKFEDFQAEYEGSIPFTRSKNDFNDLAQEFQTFVLAPFRQF